MHEHLCVWYNKNIDMMDLVLKSVDSQTHFFKCACCYQLSLFNVSFKIKMPILPSRDIPTSKHFFNLQYWQLFLVKGVMSHFSSFAHLWFIPWVMHLLKKPYKQKTNTIPLKHSEIKLKTNVLFNTNDI